ncbi:hypothetical protein VSH64_26795 [Amycolatopsis rhabdoformis]|uniref:Uncharacterized protein n=1 Tax=Amycolatopsis rhabdoformis TaxID=1448059 RepID=A0ABZ1HWE5_9PSEU|nr:hypothetical protein [Amycolatopsis rhabdoformis]WSE26488.1 hypothetical protein VSH64_26795 [Amycolatopsis rhabdoformis]
MGAQAGAGRRGTQLGWLLRVGHPRDRAAIELDFGGPEEAVWERCRETFYHVDTLDSGQLKRLETAFRTATRELVEHGELRAGMTMRIVETRLRVDLPR